MQHERMGFVELTPSGAHLALVAELSSRRRPAELHECRIRAISKIQQLGVDAPTLPVRPAIEYWEDEG
jgi:hypothetical protein